MASKDWSGISKEIGRNILVNSVPGAIAGSVAVSALTRWGFLNREKTYANLSEESLRRIAQLVAQQLDESRLQEAKLLLNSLQQDFGEYCNAPGSRESTLDHLTNSTQELVVIFQDFRLSAFEYFHVAASLRLLVLEERLIRYQDEGEKKNIIARIHDYVSHSISMENELRSWLSNRSAPVSCKVISLGSSNRRGSNPGKNKFQCTHKFEGETKVINFFNYTQPRSPGLGYSSSRGSAARKGKYKLELSRIHKRQESLRKEAVDIHNSLIKSQEQEYENKYFSDAKEIRDFWNKRRRNISYLRIKNKTSLSLIFVLDLHSMDINKERGKVQLYSSSGAENQQWKIVNITENIICIKNRANEQALTINPSFTSNNGGQVYVEKYQGNSNQHWIIEKTDQDNWIWFKNQTSGFALDLHAPDANKEGGKVHQFPYHGGEAQHWMIEYL